MDSSPSSKMPKASVEAVGQQPEQPAKPTLLPAFEPLSSSPFPRPHSAKRKFGEESPSYPQQQLKFYPTPVPTSSTGILPSSPHHAHSGLQRTVSALTERAPLGNVPTVDLPADGEIVRMGRSTNSSDYQLSTSRLISRVHVQAAYYTPTASYPNGYIEVECLGWNGAKIHCKGRVFELAKGDTYMSENPEAEIMLDVQDTRVMLAWPPAPMGKLSWDSDDDISPTRRPAHDHLASSPPVVPRSPVSQSPIRQPVFNGLDLPAPSAASIQVFEDPDARDENAENIPSSPTPAEQQTFRRPSQSDSQQRSPAKQDPKSSVLSTFADDFSDSDEENDPVVHSFGPFGDNILNGLASFSTDTPLQSGPSGQRRRHLPRVSESPKRRSTTEAPNFKISPIKNHVINQLAFSRLHSQPLSGIHGNLPAELKACITKSSEDNPSDSSGTSTPTPQLSKEELKRMLDDIACVGEIPRSGKDAAGQPLENEFYYVPEMDTDQMRRDTVTSGMRGTGLRNVRKSHKQYYWKKPRV